MSKCYLTYERKEFFDKIRKAVEEGEALKAKVERCFSKDVQNEYSDWSGYYDTYLKDAFDTEDNQYYDRYHNTKYLLTTSMPDQKIIYDHLEIKLRALRKILKEEDLIKSESSISGVAVLATVAIGALALALIDSNGKVRKIIKDAPRKYQFFISSVQSDFEKERNMIIEAVIDSGNMPVAMEYFVASPLNQQEYISKVLDGCDYMILFIANKHGKIIPGEDRSYTEWEYDFATEHNIPIISFQYREGDISYPDDVKRFATRVDEKGGIVRRTDRDNLKLDISNGIRDVIKNKKRPGWMSGKVFES